ncbi:MAG: ComF family protein [Chloroflexi bacterium]|nr:ComF family protein [Chloroflexota bacterium]
MDLLFPPHCVGCGQEGSFLCPTCREASPRLLPPYCHACGVPLPTRGICPRCGEEPLALHGLRSPYLMDGAIRQAIHRLKYNNLKALAPELSALLADYLDTTPLPAQALVPVPLHPKRERERGYNQAALLARELGKRTGLPVVSGCLQRLRDSPPQARASSAADRRQRVAGAFVCTNDSLRGVQVLLIDDVSTTGATLDACARTLRAAGAASVWGLTLAREP